MISLEKQWFYRRIIDRTPGEGCEMGKGEKGERGRERKETLVMVSQPGKKHKMAPSVPEVIDFKKEKRKKKNCLIFWFFFDIS